MKSSVRILWTKRQKIPSLRTWNFFIQADRLGISSRRSRVYHRRIEEFIKYINERYNSFIELESFVEEGCVAPFYIEEDLKTNKRYWNPAHIRLIEESEISILRRWEYEEKLKKVISEKCVHCVHYSENTCEQDLKSHIEHIDLNGECYGYEKKK